MTGEELGCDGDSGLADSRGHMLYPTIHAVSTALWGWGLPIHFCFHFIILLAPC